jgi:hypothetical protein
MTRQLTHGRNVPGGQTASGAGRTLVLVSITLAGLALIGLGLVIPSLHKRDKVGMSADNLNELAGRRAIPAIDAAVPADVKTATFALG